ncbi:MAG: hypothetical protein CTY15_09060 [Methylocystis sp.]|nr:MAG: hypothetical protein CTY15_09060 [Methylocystis sp.]
MRYRRIPAEVLAWQYTEPMDGLPDWIDARQLCRLSGSRSIVIMTPEGQLEAEPGDWFIRDASGALFPMKPWIFETRFEPAPADAG